MIFCASAHEFVLVIEREDVVAHYVFTAVILVESSTLAFIDDVVFNQDAGGAFIEIDPPTSVCV